MALAKEARSRPLLRASARASSAWSRSRHRLIGRRPSVHPWIYTAFTRCRRDRVFDRSWYNRAGVETVMGFVTNKQHDRFLELCPRFEKYLIDEGVRLIKLWLEVSNEEQECRFEARVKDPLRQWKLSPMDLPSASLVRLFTCS